MTDFSFDTSGTVHAPRPGVSHPFGTMWADLSPFVQGYVEALFASVGELIPRWNSMDERTELERPAFSDLDPSARALILRDCEAFVATHRADLNEAQHGADFHTDRQRGWLRPRFPPLQPYLSEAGKVCLREAA